MKNPFHHNLIAFSISNADNMAALGYGKEHYDDLLTRICQLILSLKGKLAYGGNLDGHGYTNTLLSMAYAEGINENDEGTTSQDDSEFNQWPESFYSFLCWPISEGLTVETKATYTNMVRFVCSPHPYAGSDAEASELFSSRDKMRRYCFSRSLSEMRLSMTTGDWKHPDGSSGEPLAARIILGGKISDYSGIIPGIAEEALYCLEENIPLFVIGGFGGCTALLAKALQDKECPEELTLEGQRGMSGNQAKLEGLLNIYEAEGKLADVEQLYDRLRHVLTTEAYHANGLSKEQNELLYRTENIQEVLTLLELGLSNLNRKLT